MTKTMKDAPPRCQQHEIHRLTENGDGSCLWAIDTDFNLAEVLGPDFFRGGGRHGLKKNDRIYCVCEQHASRVTHATLVVTASRMSGAEVVQIGEAYQIEIGQMTAWERLGIESTANKDEIERAYRERAKLLHPDKGGDKKDMQALNKARDEAMLIAEHRQQERAA